MDAPPPEEVEAPAVKASTQNPQSLFCLCARRLALRWRVERRAELRALLPPHIFAALAALWADIALWRLHLPPDVNTGDERRQGDGIEIQGTQKKAELPECCYLLDSDTRQLDFVRSALATEAHISRLDFFDVCSKFALDQPTERVYATLSEREQEALIGRDPVVMCRALELSPRRAILHYDEIALASAEGGYLCALERSLMRVREGMDTALLQQCVLLAITRRHFHIANRVRADNYSTAFHRFFPDGRVSAQFFALLLDREKLKPEVGLQIANELLDWLPKQSVQRLRRQLRNAADISASVLHRFDSMYRECIDERDFPCEYD